MNQTHDHYEVPSEMYCEWVLVDCYGFKGINHWRDLVCLKIESNWERGDKRRYWSLMVLGFNFQGGWLWTTNATDTEVE